MPQPRTPWHRRTVQWLTATIVAGAFALFRLLPVRAASNFGAAIGRLFGPRLPVSNVARANLTRAFPDKTPTEIELIVRGVWDNLGRTACEYPYLDRLWDFEPGRPAGSGRIEVEGAEIFLRLKAQDKPAIIFTGHLANWELLAVCAAHYDLPIAVFFRQPNNPYINRLIARIRGGTMGKLLATDMLGAIAAGKILEQGHHIGLLVDQHFTRGPAIPFFGRPARTAPTLAKLALRYDCQVHGARVERLAGGRFRVSITEALPLPATGTRAERVDALLTEVNAVLEGWVREHPEQWLWLHRRWR